MRACVCVCVCMLAYVSVSACLDKAKEATIKCFETAHDPTRMTKPKGNVKTKTAHVQLGWWRWWWRRWWWRMWWC